MKIGEKINVEGTSLASGGEGIARVGEEGFVVFVPGLLPGEKGTVLIQTIKKRYATGILCGRLTKSADRVKPRCPIYGRCGGCQLQHMSYEAQLRFKSQMVADLMARMAGIEFKELPFCTPSPSQWGYRNKASFPIQNRKDDRLSWGYYASRSHHIISITECPVLEPDLLELSHATMNALKKHSFEGYDEQRSLGNLRYLVVRKASCTGELLAGIVAGRSQTKREIGSLRTVYDELSPSLPGLKGVVLNVNPEKGNFIWGPLFKTLSGKNNLVEQLSSFQYEADISSFFQVNSKQAEQLFEYASTQALQGKPNRILELYCGGGSLTAYLASAGVPVDAVEEWRPAVRLLRRNIEINELSNVTAFESSAEKIFDRLDPTYDVVVLDPPRSGCAPSVLEGMARILPSKVVYISCNPATLARDVAILKTKGYELETIRLFDLFPQTSHVETVVSMVKTQR